MKIYYERLPIDDSELRLYHKVFSTTESEDIFKTLKLKLDWQERRINLFGREVASPRLSAWYGGRPYTYSGLTWPKRDMPRELIRVQLEIEKITGYRFNTVLANLYRNGEDSMGWHADDEPELGLNPIIASTVFGATRRFQFRRKDNHRDKREVALTAGDVLIMGAACQTHWQHAVPKTKKQVGQRVNLTYRWIF